MRALEKTMSASRVGTMVHERNGTVLFSGGPSSHAAATDRLLSKVENRSVEVPTSYLSVLANRDYNSGDSFINLIPRRRADRPSGLRPSSVDLAKQWVRGDLELDLPFIIEREVCRKLRCEEVRLANTEQTRKHEAITT